MVQKRKDIKARRVWKKKIPRLHKIEEYSVASNAVEAQVRNPKAGTCPRLHKSESSLPD